jgi:hypothetical protein
MNVSSAETTMLVLIAALVIAGSLCRWSYLDATAHGAGAAWRVVSALPIIGVIVWLRFGRERHRWSNL